MDRFNLIRHKSLHACDTNCVIDIKWDSVESGKHNKLPGRRSHR